MYRLDVVLGTSRPRSMSGFFALCPLTRQSGSASASGYSVCATRATLVGLPSFFRYLGREGMGVSLNSGVLSCRFALVPILALVRIRCSAVRAFGVWFGACADRWYGTGR